VAAAVRDKLQGRRNDSVALSERDAKLYQEEYTAVDKEDIERMGL